MKLYLVIIYLWLANPSCVCNTVKNPKSQVGENKPMYTYGKASVDGTGKFYYGREISQVMGSGGAPWLERDDRQEEENVNLAIEKMNLRQEDVVADIGAGTGYYSFRIAKKVPNGKVFAIEIQDDFVDYLNKKKKELHITNVEVVKGSINSPGLQENLLDLAIMADVYHELEFPHEMLQSIRNSLKPGGKLLLLEYRGEDSSIAIKPLHKTTIEQLDKELNANGFVLSYDGEFLPIQHFLLYEKKKEEE